ncbi:MAG: hypothetical protein IH623_03775 [Verrucomicrobia bacterium]|nr:hypothetical protein [Verrucomicrobiota bacterium]
MMKRISSVYAAVVALLVLCLGAMTASAATICVGPSATGNGSGSDWNNKAQWSSVTLTRGNTYYLADGTYAGRTVNTAASGSTYITIKKATVGDATVEGITGWNSADGDGQASFTGVMQFQSSYWIFDGVKGSMSRTMTDYGFTFTTATRYVVRAFNTSQNISDITISHISWTAPSGDQEKHFFQTHNETRSVHRLTISHCLSDGHSNFIWGTSPGVGTPHDDWVTEHCIMRRTYSSAAIHGEDLNNNYGNIRNWHMRYNIFEVDGPGGGPTGVIVVLNGSAGPWYIYGNVFKDLQWAEVGVGGIHHPMTGGFYNNTFINCRSDYNHVQWVGGGGQNRMTVRNNLIVNMQADRTVSSPGTISHTTYANCTSVPTETSREVLGSSPLVNIAGLNFRLATPTAAGEPLAAPFNLDPDGKVRGADGNWDRGAFEFGTTSGGNLTVNAGSDQSVTLPNSATLAGSYVNPSGGIVSLGWSKVSGPGTVTFSAPSAATTSATFSSAGTYVLRLTASTLASVSDDVTVTVLAAADTTAPTVNLTAPAAGAVVSNSITLSATASDNTGGSGVASVTFLVNGVAVGTDTSSPYSLTWDSQTLANGSHSIAARAQDVAGNQTTSVARTVTVQNPVADTTPPSVGLTAPAAGAVVSNSITLSATASDNVGIVGVRFFASGSEVFDDTIAPYSYAWDSRGVNNGSHQIYAQARDAAGNIRWSGTNTITVANPPAALPDPVAYWNFNEGSGTTAMDSQANNNLTLRNGATPSAVGRFGTGLLLDGINDRADAPDSASLNITGGAISAAAWVKLESQGTWQQIIAKVKETGAFTSPYFAWHLFGSHASTTQWTPRFQLVNANGISVDAGSSVNVNYGEWVHVAGVYDGSAVRIYVNGVDQGSAAQTGNILSYNQPLYIGAHGLPGEFAKGVIDEVRVYSQALSAAQVQALYQQNEAPTPPSPPVGLRISDPE